jgi:hypothetical protein
MNTEKPCAHQCQSCGLPLEKGKQSGTEADGSKSDKYCYLCYKDGKFVAPDITLEEMKKIVDNVLKQKGWWKPARWFALMQIPHLERWKGETHAA